MSENEIFTISLKDIMRKHPRKKRAAKAVKRIKEEMSKILKDKLEGKKLVLSPTVSMYLWQHGARKPPKKVKLEYKEDNDKITVDLAEQEEGE